MERKDFETVVGRWQEAWLRLGTRALGDEDEARDALQETLLRLWVVRRRLATEQDVGKLGTRIMKNECVNVFRRRSRWGPEPCGGEDAPMKDVEDDWHERVEGRERSELLRWAVDHLGEQARMLLQLHLYEEMTLDEIAAATGKTKGSIKTMISRAKQQITRWLRTTNN